MKTKTTKKILAYHFVGDKLRDGRPVPPDGEWLEHNGEPALCKSGLHASIDPFDALQYAPGNTLCLVECSGVVVYGDDKLVCTRRKIVKRINAEPLLRQFACKQALSVVHLWNAPAVVREYLETGDKSKRAAAWDAARAAAWDAVRAAAMDAAMAAAMDAAWAAARAAAWDATGAAARAAAWDAARDAARAAARGQFNKMVEESFRA